MELEKILRGVELFDGLNKSELTEIGSICQKRVFEKGDLLAIEGQIGNDLFIVVDGVVEVEINSTNDPPEVVVNLGTGQIIGEMALVDQGPRSATVRAIHTPTTVQVIRFDAFHELCRKNTKIGYMVMYNMAADLSFKLRHRHLSDR
jgi:CRP-like cAMP-binding protein